MATIFSAIGRSIGRAEGPLKVSGREVYGVDVTRPGMLWGKALRSPFPHARILSIDASRARQLPGVHAVITGEDLPGEKVGRVLRDMPVLAEDRVLFAGEKVAAVAAESLEIAEEALLLIDVEYEQLAEVLDPWEAMKPESPVLHPDLPPYEGVSGPTPGGVNDYGRLSWSMGDVERGFAESDVVLEHTFDTQLMHQGYLEPHACVVEIDQGGRIHVWANNKTPYALRRQLAQAARLTPQQILVHPCTIGGDFGGKGSFMDTPLCYFLAQASGRPVKMVMTYLEELMAGNPRHPSTVTIKSGLSKDGALKARHVQIMFPRGAYGAFIPAVFLGGARYALGSYRIPSVSIEGRMVYTNTVPCGHFRAPGEAQVLFAVESHTDLLAKAIGMDPLEFRLQNVIGDGDVAPSWEGVEGIVPETFVNSRGVEVLRRAAEVSHWSDRPKGQNVGRGMAMANRRPGTGTGHCILRLDGDGRVSVLTPLLETGTGAQTITKQIVAEELGVTVEDIGLEVLDSDALASDSGVGAMRVTYTHGWAAVYAARELKARLVGLASTLLEWPRERIVYEHGLFQLDNDQERSYPFQELAAMAVAASGEPIIVQHQVESEMTHGAAFSAQVVDVQVDTETGQVDLLSLTTVNEIGTMLNPMAHQGQIEGGIVMGLGYAFTEELGLEDGRVTTLSLGDYKLPTIQDIPHLQTVLVEGSVGPMPYQGWGVGESTLAPVAPAIANAIEDATGVRVTSLPITAEKLLRVLRENRGASPD